jgi:hypothetical protein
MGHIRPNLRQYGGGAVFPEAGDRLKQFVLALIWRQALADASVEPKDLRFEVRHVIQTHLDDKAMVIGQMAVQGLLDERHLWFQFPVGEARDLIDIDLSVPH